MRSFMKIFMLLSAVFCASLFGKAWHVAPGGSGGTLASVQRAVDSARAGDTVLIHTGTYVEKVTLTRSGADENRRIVIRNRPGDRPVIDGTGIPLQAWSGLVSVENASFITVTGIEIRNSRENGLWCRNPVRVIAESLNVHHNGKSGIIFNGPSNPSYSRVTGCDVHDNVHAGISPWECPGGHFWITGNTVHHNQGVANYDAIQIVDCPYVVVSGNIVYDNCSASGTCEGDQIDAGGTNQLTSPSHHIIYENNLVYGMGGGVKMNNEPLYGIIRRNVILETGFDLYESPTRIAIYHNTLADAYHTIMIWGDGVGENFGGTRFRNNLFVDPSGYLLAIENKADHSPSSLSFDYNGYRFGTRGIDINSPTLQGTYGTGASEFTRYKTETGQELHGTLITQTQALLFNNAAAKDYSLKNGSVAIDKGGPLAVVTSASGSGVNITVDNSWAFQDGWHGLLPPDTLVIGSNPPICVDSVDYANHVIRLRKSAVVARGDGVRFAFGNNAPDLGAFESGNTMGGPSSQGLAPAISLLAHPNPFNSALTLTLEHGLPATVADLEILDVTGKLLLKTSLQGGTFVWNAAGRPFGIYLVRIRTDGRIFLKQVVLAK